MDIILRTGFSSVTHSINFSVGVIEKGKKLAFCHIKFIEERTQNDRNTIIAKCIRQTSVTAKEYLVQLEVVKYLEKKYVQFGIIQFFLQLVSNRHVIHRICTCIAQSGRACYTLASGEYFSQSSRDSQQCDDSGYPSWRGARENERRSTLHLALTRSYDLL